MISFPLLQRFLIAFLMMGPAFKGPVTGRALIRPVYPAGTCIIGFITDYLTFAVFTAPGRPFGHT
jgi:hypothetical protein